MLAISRFRYDEHLAERALSELDSCVRQFSARPGFLQGTVGDWAEQLAGLAIDEGISTFILGTEGYIELRKYLDVGREDEGDHHREGDGGILEWP